MGSLAKLGQATRSGNAINAKQRLNKVYRIRFDVDLKSMFMPRGQHASLRLPVAYKLRLIHIPLRI